MNKQKKVTDMTLEELENLFADKTMPEWFDYLTPDEGAKWFRTLELPADQTEVQNWLDELTPPEELQEWMEQLQAQNDVSEEEIPFFCFSNPDPYAGAEPSLLEFPCHNIHFAEDGTIHVRNLSAHWIPKLTVTEEISGTIYTVTGSYEGTESFLRKLERIAAKNFTEKLEEAE